MIRIDIISVIPDLMKSFFEFSICKRAQKNNLVEIVLHDLHNFSSKKHRQVDDYPFGGGAGMVLSPEPLSKAINQLQSERTYDEVIFFTPDGETLTQPIAKSIQVFVEPLLTSVFVKNTLRKKYQLEIMFYREAN